MPTTIAQAKAFILKSHEKSLAENQALLNKATVDAEGIIAMIVRDFKPKRIYQWGSLTKKDAFRDYSDIDIAIEGLNSSQDIFSIIGKAKKITNFPLDILELEKIEQLHADSIRKNGKIVYEE
jgi:predicted nucleotidyltransferase